MSSVISAKLSDREKVVVLEDKVQSLEHQLDWFKRQLFGRKSEKRLLEDPPNQPLLDGLVVETPASSPSAKETITYTRAKQRGTDCVTDAGLRFDASVPKKTKLEGPNAEDYEVIREQHTYRLRNARPSPVLKHRASQRGTAVTVAGEPCRCEFRRRPTGGEVCLSPATVSPTSASRAMGLRWPAGRSPTLHTENSSRYTRRSLYLAQ